MPSLILPSLKKLEIPYCLHGDIASSSSIVIHLNCANASSSISKLFKLPKEKNYCFLSLDLPGHGESLNKSYRWNCNYLKVIKAFICQIKETYKNIYKVFLSGESWGANLAIMFCDKYKYLINGITCWNAPSKIINIKEGNKKKFDIILKHIVTFLFNIRYQTTAYNIQQLTDNKIFLRIWKMNLKARNSDAKINIAAWISMLPAWTKLKKQFKQSDTTPITYIQSKQDIYFKSNNKWIKKINTHDHGINKLIIINQGMHLLSLDPCGNDKVIWDEIQNMVNKNA